MKSGHSLLVKVPLHLHLSLLVSLGKLHPDLSVSEAATSDGEKEVEEISSLSDVELRKKRRMNQSQLGEAFGVKGRDERYTERKQTSTGFRESQGDPLSRFQRSRSTVTGERGKIVLASQLDQVVTKGLP